MSFDFEEPLLAPESTSISCQRTVCTDHAVTGHNQGDLVGSVGARDGACGCRLPKTFRDIGVATCVSGRDPPQFIPDASLECTAAIGQWSGKTGGYAAKECLQFTPDLLAWQRFADPDSAFGKSIQLAEFCSQCLAIDELQKKKLRRAASSHHAPQRRFNPVRKQDW